MTKDDIQKQALDSWIDNGCSGVVVMTMGSGKGKLFIDAIKNIKPAKVLIVSPRTNLKENTLPTELLKWGKYLRQLLPNTYLYGWDTDTVEYQCYVTIQIIQTCYKWYREVVNKYDLIIIDEAHLVISQEYSSIVVKALQLKKKILGLTGTPNKSEEFKAQFYNCLLYTSDAADE